MTDPIATQAVYDGCATTFDQNRSKVLFEKAWLDQFTALVPAAGHILDLGCGSAEPIAAYLIEQGYAVTGLDASPAMIDLAKGRFPDQAWLVGDMRSFQTDQVFDGVLAWNSLFHLSMDDQRTTLPRLAQMLRSGGPLMFTAGPGEGEAYGTVAGQPVYHASLTTQGYRSVLTPVECQLIHVVLEDPNCQGHSVYLAQKA